jgi:hypothetical protein
MVVYGRIEALASCVAAGICDRNRIYDFENKRGMIEGVRLSDDSLHIELYAFGIEGHEEWAKRLEGVVDIRAIRNIGHGYREIRLRCATGSDPESEARALG